MFGNEPDECSKDVHWRATREFPYLFSKVSP